MVARKIVSCLCVLIFAFSFCACKAGDFYYGKNFYFEYLEKFNNEFDAKEFCKVVQNEGGVGEVYYGNSFYVIGEVKDDAGKLKNIILISLKASNSQIAKLKANGNLKTLQKLQNIINKCEKVAKNAQKMPNLQNWAYNMLMGLNAENDAKLCPKTIEKLTALATVKMGDKLKQSYVKKVLFCAVVEYGEILNNL